MKLNKSKLGLSLIVFLAATFLFSLSVGVVAENVDHVLSKTQFKDLTGDYLSNGSVGGRDIEAGDTLLLDFDEVVQEKPLLIDLEGISVRPEEEGETVVIEQDWSGGLTPPPPPDGMTTLAASDDDLYDEVDASIVVLGAGVTLDSLKFKPSSPPGGDGPANAIEVDFCIYGSSKALRFHNLAMPISGSGGGFVNGFKFDGSVSDILTCGTGGTDYTEGIYFKDVRLEGENSDGIQGNGVVFTENVEDVANVDFEQFYAGYVDDYPAGYSSVDGADPLTQGGNGIIFNNEGSIKDVTIADSERTAPSVSELDYALENNASNGMLINGKKVTEVGGLEFNYTRIEDNAGSGVFVRGEEGNSDPISSLDMTVKNTLLAGNNYGVLVASDGPSTGVAEQGYSPVIIEDVRLGDNLKVYDNQNGGALFNVQAATGSKSSPALTVSDSQFHRDESSSDSEENDQDFGLRVDAYEGMSGIEVSESTFRYHGNNTYSGAGIELRTPGTGNYYDQVQGVTVKDTSSQYNHGAGLSIYANVIEDVEVTSSGGSKAKFSGNGQADSIVSSGNSGISFAGLNQVTNLTVSGEEGGGEVLANDNDGYGLLVESKEEITGVEVENAHFGNEVNNNGNGQSGVKLTTTGSESDYDIGSDESSGAISFDNVLASGNDEHGIEINAAGNFVNPSEEILVNNSEFKENQADGLHLYASEDVKRPRVEISTFVGNNVSDGTAGIFIEAEGEEVRGTGDGDIVDNVVADNEVGIAVTDPAIVDDDTYLNRIIDFSVQGNTTGHPSDSDYSGNSLANVVLAADNLNTVKVTENILVSAYQDGNEEASTNYGLWLEANGSSASIMVEDNKFDSGAEGFCVGIGTAIHLDAKKTTVEKNEIDGFNTAVAVLQEDSGSSDSSDPSNSISRNNILGCCTLIDATALDYSNGEKVDATDNYWGKDLTKENLKPNLKSDSANPFDQIYVEPLRDDPVDVIKDITITLDTKTADPGVNETVELDYDITNNTSSSKTVDADLTISNPDDEQEYDKTVESESTIQAEDQISDTIEFTPQMEGTFTAEMVVNVTNGEKYTETYEFEIGKGGEPKEEKPYWGQDGEKATSGILPAPVDGESTPKLRLRTQGDNPVDADKVSMMVFDLTGKKVWSSEDVDTNDLSALESLQNGLYIYTVKVEVSGETYNSPAMKFIVKQ